MPIYEYACRGCGHRFETLVLKGPTPACPECKGEDLQRLLSAPAVTSESTRARGLQAARARDRAQAAEKNRAQREYELRHND